MENDLVDLKIAHRHSSYHRNSLLVSETCGCFYCLRIFGPLEIKEWIEPTDNEVGQTALCPKCGIDSVIGSASGLPITSVFLEKMHQYWFTK